ncbi:transmembrane protein, putative [Medicago truncatula]|uniref:Transmembrane protein, putative n=1 Tax=Medicago truncatula TaxID=3880 RepID=A0A072TSB2_MEDTR|nr:transmembrane protein, putative [Medicago truncatula]
MILNVDGSSLGNPGIFVGVCLGMRMVLGFMDLLEIYASITFSMWSYWQFIMGYVLPGSLVFHSCGVILTQKLQSS